MFSKNSWLFVIPNIWPGSPLDPTRTLKIYSDIQADAFFLGKIVPKYSTSDV